MGLGLLCMFIGKGWRPGAGGVGQRSFRPLSRRTVAIRGNAKVIFALPYGLAGASPSRYATRKVKIDDVPVPEDVETRFQSLKKGQMDSSPNHYEKR